MVQGGLAAAIAIYLADQSVVLQSAHAAITWFHPFTFHSGYTNTYSTPGYTSTTSNPQGLHHALDYDPGYGTPIYPVAAGTVEVVGAESDNQWYGNYVRVSHGDGYWSSYSHLRDTPVVSGSISTSTVLGYVGNTGQSQGAHLHLEIMSGGNSRSNPDNRIDPFALVHNAPLALSSPPSPPEQGENMAVGFTLSGTGTRAIAGLGIGDAAWIESTDAALMTALAVYMNGKPFVTVSQTHWDMFKAKFTTPLSVTVVE